MPRILLAEIGYQFYIAGDVYPVAQGSSGAFTFTAKRGSPPVWFDLTSNLPGAEWTLTDNGDGTATVAWVNATTPGTFELTVEAIDSERYPAIAKHTIKVIALPLEISGPLDDSTVGSPYTDTLTFTGGVGPFSIVPGYLLPSGLTASLAGGNSSPLTIAGTDTGDGIATPGTSFPFDVSVTIQDSSDPPQQATYTQTINRLVTPVSAVFVPTPLDDAQVGTPFSGAVSGSGGIGGFTYSKQVGPSTWTIDAGTGAIGGTPVNGDVGTGVTVTARATDSAGNYDDVTDTIDVAPLNFVDTYVSGSNIAFVYGLKRLVSTYTGPLIRVRRSSDNAEQDIGYLSNTTLDTAALATFVGGASAFVVTWYDQSGAADHVTQATAANQPRIVNAGTYLGFVEFDGVTDLLNCTHAAALGTTSTTMFMRAEWYASGTAGGGVYSYLDMRYSIATAWRLYWYPLNNVWGAVVANTTSAVHTETWTSAQFDPTGSQHLISFFLSTLAVGGGAATKINVFLDGGSDIAGTVGSQTTSGNFSGTILTIGKANDVGGWGRCDFTHIVITKGDQRSHRANVEALL